MIKITGYSDDIIDISGDIEDEFYLNDDEMILGCSDGTLLQCGFDSHGTFRVHLLARGSAPLTKTEGVLADDTNDVVVLDGPITWVTGGTAVARPIACRECDDGLSEG